MNKFPISAMVVGFNEIHFLNQCFESISFCDEILYTDLGSNDGSIEIAKKYCTQIYKRAKVPSCEMIQAEMVHKLKNDWVIFIDPDERIDETLVKQILDNFENFRLYDNIGAVTVPWQFYFKKHKLLGTVWGGKNKKFLLVNKNRFDFFPLSHYGRKLKKDFLSYEIELNKKGTNILHHYWMKSWKVFLFKHVRYLKNEGTDQYNLGVRIGKKNALFMPFTAFKNSFFDLKGYKDGFKGLFLSFFWSYYKTKIAFDILKIQSKNKGE